MPSTPSQTTENTGISPAHLDFPEPNSRGIYTGESRLPFRERIRRMRDHSGVPTVPKLVRRDTPFPSKRTPSSSTGKAPKTPPMPVSMSLPVCPGAPRKSKVSELCRSSPNEVYGDDEDVLLDRKANERVRRNALYPDVVGGYVTPSRRSSLRNSWEPDQPSEVSAQLRLLLDKFALGEEDAGA
ncbi:hypothetical protein F5Y12DRAFT_791039 [Xylaria sp. FL1777]|nr:hypothetical protein F5Y12DRAFT_791039 [Xylaria sp. FL1777]